MLVEKHDSLSIQEQCDLLDLSRRTYYYEPKTESAENLQIMRLLDEIYLDHPYYGSRKMTAILQRQGYLINRKRVQRLMRLIGIEAIYPQKRTTIANKEHQKYPYLLRNLDICQVNQVWSSDITYLPVFGGFFYLTAVIDVFSRFVVGWKISNSMDTSFCIEAVEDALLYGKPDILNTDQGSQYTSTSFTSLLKSNEIQISMNGKGRCIDNVWVERLWRSVKREDVYLREYRGGTELYTGLNKYFHFYNFQRPHQALNYRTPSEIFRQKTRQEST